MTVRHVIESACLSVDDDPAVQSFDHWELVCDSIFRASKIRIKSDNPVANAFPGDHYRLLSGLLTSMESSRPLKSIVEIGTHYGNGTRIFLDYTKEASVASFDITSWEKHNTTYLTNKDFESNGGRLVHYTDDLKKQDAFVKHAELLALSDFIMCDGPKDGVFEKTFLHKLSFLDMPKKRRFLFLDDIQFLSEILLWRSIQSPKVDLTSFGHFTGSGLVDISEGLKLS